MEDSTYYLNKFIFAGLNVLRFIKLHIFLFLFVLFFVDGVAFAITIVPTGREYESGGVRYHYTVTSWEGGGHKVCSRDESNGNPGCFVAIGGLQRPGDGRNMVFGEQLNSQPLKPGSMTEVREQIPGFNIPYDGSVFVPNKPAITDEFCISFLDLFYGGAGGYWWPKGPCVRVSSQEVLRCELRGDSMINHGVVTEASASGNEAGATLQLTCSGETTLIAAASIESPSGVRLRDDGSLYSKLTIDGKNAAGGVLIQVKRGLSTSINLKSTLFTKGALTPGIFTGSTVLTISPP